MAGWSFQVADTFAPCASPPEAVAREDGILITWVDFGRPVRTGYQVSRRTSGGEWGNVSRRLPLTEEGNRYLDTSAEPGVLYDYAVDVFDPDGLAGRCGTASAQIVMPTRFEVRVSPNPGKGAMELVLSLPQTEEIRLQVFDLKGRNIADTVLAALLPGPHRAHWEPHDAGGRPLASGSYFVRVETRSERRTVRWIVIK